MGWRSLREEGTVFLASAPSVVVSNVRRVMGGSEETTTYRPVNIASNRSFFIVETAVQSVPFTFQTTTLQSG